MATLPTYFISHGGGPWPWMKEQMGGVYDRLEASLARMPDEIGRRPRTSRSCSRPLGNLRSPRNAGKEGAG